jgi:hypothetical protein
MDYKMKSRKSIHLVCSRVVLILCVCVCAKCYHTFITEVKKLLAS